MNCIQTRLGVTGIGKSVNPAESWKSCRKKACLNVVYSDLAKEEVEK